MILTALTQYWYLPSDILLELLLYDMFWNSQSMVLKFSDESENVASNCKANALIDAPLHVTTPSGLHVWLKKLTQSATENILSLSIISDEVVSELIGHFWIICTSGVSIQHTKEDSLFGQMSSDKPQFWPHHVYQMPWIEISLSVLPCDGIWMSVAYEHVHTLINKHI